MKWFMSLDNLVMVDAETETEAIQKAKQKFLEMLQSGKVEIIVADSE